MNARFWIWYKHSPVKITLEENCFQHLNTFEETEEGFIKLSKSYSIEGKYIYEQIWRVTRDCDGLYAEQACYRCLIKELKTNSIQVNHKAKVIKELNEMIGFPEWEEVSRTKRDLQAESAGY